MTVITVKETHPVEQHIAQLKIWKRDAKKFRQTALYDLLSESIDLMNKLYKEKPNQAVQSFTHTKADLAFSNYIRARANYCCEKCGTQYPEKSTGLQCSHHYSRRYYSIRFNPDNAMALCHHCHNYWFSKNIPESYAFLLEKLGKKKLAVLQKLKDSPDATAKPTASELDQIAEYWQQQTLELKQKS